MADEQLVEEAQKGNKDALVQLMMERKNEYYRLAYVYLRNQDDALDVLQEMIVAVYGNIHKLKQAHSFHPWAKTILVNSCRNILRKRGRLIPFDGVSGDFAGMTAQPSEIGGLGGVSLGTVPSHASAVESRLDLGAAMKHLNNFQKEAVILKYYLDLDYETIGQITHTPVGTVKSRVFNGLKRLKELIDSRNLREKNSLK